MKGTLEMFEQRFAFFAVLPLVGKLMMTAAPSPGSPSLFLKDLLSLYYLVHLYIERADKTQPKCKGLPGRFGNRGQTDYKARIIRRHKSSSFGKTTQSTINL